MRVGISLFQFFRGRVGGAGEYIAQMVPRLAHCLAAGDRLLLFGSTENLEPFAGIADPRVERLHFDLSRRATVLLRMADLLVPGACTRSLAARVNAARPDVVLFPQQSLFPAGIAAPKAVTVVDLLHRHFPQQFGSFECWLRHRKDRQIVTQAETILCISETTRRDLRQTFAIPDHRMRTVHLAGSGNVMRPASAMEPEVPYLLYPANAYPHKNHAGLIAAFQQFRLAHPEVPGRLVLTGGRSPQLSRLLRNSTARDQIEHLGYVSAERLAELYAGCRAVVFPSLFEGFGIPILEAMEHGKPIYCSDLPVLREVAGDSVSYFEPSSTDSLAAALRDAFTATAQTAATQKYPAVLQRFSWERCARDTYTALADAVDAVDAQRESGLAPSRAA